MSERTATIHRRTGETAREADALQSLAAVLAPSPERTERLLRLAAIAEIPIGDMKRAHTALEVARRDNPNDLRVLRALRSFHERAGDPATFTALIDRVIADVRRAADHTPRDLPAIERLAYFAELAGVQLAGLQHLVLVDAKSPVSFFAYPGKASDLVPPGCTVHTLAAPDQDALAGLEQLVAALGAGTAQPVLQTATRPDRPTGQLTAAKVCQAVGHLLPEGAILVDEAITSGQKLGAMTAGAPRHDLLTLTGGAIGQGLPSAVGAAIACPQRPVIVLEGDGSAMYTVQALWTMAREQLHVISVIFNNASYSVLNIELERVGAGEPGPRSRAQLDLGGPQLDFARLAQGMGVHAVRADTAEAFCTALEYALATPGPHLIEALVPESIAGAKRKVLPWVLGATPHLPQPVAQVLKRAISP